jgi:uncharacterized protein
VHEDFEWDEAKSAETLAKRGFDFDFAARVFEREVLEEDDDRRHYGERRSKAIGMIEGRALVVIYTGRGHRRRIISARQANRRERDAYRAKVVGADPR